MSFFNVPGTDIVIEDNGERVYRIKNGKEWFYKIQTNRLGYKSIQLKIGEKRKTYMIHRLVAMACIPNVLNKPEVNHKDGNKANNLYTNLEWVTKSENIQHSYDTGLNKNKTGPEKMLRNSMIKEFYEKGIPQKDIAIFANMCRMQVSRICRGRTSGKIKRANNER